MFYPLPGRAYILLFKSVTPEDMGEIRFTAEKASSAAKLKVKGKHLSFEYLLIFQMLNGEWHEVNNLS